MHPSSLAVQDRGISADPCQGWGRAFESLHPLQLLHDKAAVHTAAFVVSGDAKTDMQSQSAGRQAGRNFVWRCGRKRCRIRRGSIESASHAKADASLFCARAFRAVTFVRRFPFATPPRRRVCRVSLHRQFVIPFQLWRAGRLSARGGSYWPSVLVKASFLQRGLSRMWDKQGPRINALCIVICTKGCDPRYTPTICRAACRSALATCA